MKRAFLALAALLLAGVRATAQPALDVTTTRLDNGLTVLVSRDASVGDVAVELWFRVGSSDEAAGQHGLAHLFEHLLPGASQVLKPAELRRHFLDSNGSTGTDYTNWFARMPATSVELAIAMYAERMASPPDAITDAELARHRDIVSAEFRNGAERWWDSGIIGPVRRALFGSAHPYGHAVLGTRLDVDAATTESMRRWFRRGYGASNAMLVVTGNIDSAQVVELAKKHFGSIPAGSPLPLALEPVRPRERRSSLDLTVAQAKASLILAWTTPAWNDPARQEVSIAKELLRRRLASTLACEVTDADSFTGSAGGATSLQLVGCAGAETRALAELDRFLTSTPDIAAVRDQNLADALDETTRLGWRSSRTQLLGEGFWLANDPHAYARQLERITTTNGAAVMHAARVWLAHPLVVRVSPELVTAAVDRLAPLSISAPALSFPKDVVEEKVGGATLIVVPRALPVVIGRIVTAEHVTSFTTVPSRATEKLRESLRGGVGDVVLIGDVDRAAVASLLRGSARRSESVAADPLPFTPKSGATQTTITATMVFANADAASLAIAADLLRSRLNARIREQERWSYNVDARAERRGGEVVIAVDAPVKDEAAVQALAVIREFVAAIQQSTLSAAEAVRAQGAELRRLARLASTPNDLADALVDVVRSGETYAAYADRHRALYESLREGVTLAVPAPARVTWSITGDPAKVDPSLRP